MSNESTDCPHCGAKNSVQRRSFRRLLVPVAWIVTFGTVFCFALTTVVLLMIAPLLFVIAFCLIGGVHAWVGDGDQCAACDKLVLTPGQLRRMGPVRVIQTRGGAEREVPVNATYERDRAA